MLDFAILNSSERVTFIFQNVAIVIAAIGIPGNIMTFWVLRRKRFESYNFSFYMRATCLVDIIVLAHTFRHWAMFVLEANIDLISDVLCRLAEYCLLYVNASVSVWLLSFIALDRLITIAYPYRFSFLKKRHFQWSVIAVIYVFSVLLYVSVPVLSELRVEEVFENETNSTSIVRSCELIGKSADIVYWTNLANLAAATFFANNILTILLIIFLFRIAGHKGLTKDQKNRRINRDRKFAINSIVLNIICLLSKSPFLVLSLLAYSNLDQDEAEMMTTIGETIFLLDNASSFFINFAFNSIFYEELLRMFGSRRYNGSTSARSLNNSNNNPPA